MPCPLQLGCMCIVRAKSSPLSEGARCALICMTMGRRSRRVIVEEGDQWRSLLLLLLLLRLQPPCLQLTQQPAQSLHDCRGTILRELLWHSNLMLRQARIC